MDKTFIERVKREKIVDTKRYRYYYMAGNRIVRFPLYELNNPDSVRRWETVWKDEVYLPSVRGYKWPKV